MIRVLLFLFLVPAFGYELSIAALFRDEAPYLKEWVEYHRLVGVEHFWLYNDRSVDHWKEVLQPYIDDGIVEVLDCTTGEPVHYISCQVSVYRDALSRAKGKTEWLALIDLDEFLLPVQETTLVECLSRHYAHASAIWVNWRNFGSGGIYLEPNEPILSRLLTASEESHPRNANGKSIVRPHRVAEIWNPHHAVLEEGTEYCDGSGAPIPHGWDLQVDGLRHAELLVLNHYAMRDEQFYLNVRVPRAEAWGIEPWLTKQLYDAYNEDYDFSMIEFLRKKHPQAYSQFWDVRMPGVQAELNALSLGDRLFQAAAACTFAWDKGTEPCFPTVEFQSEEFCHFLFRAPLPPVNSASLSRFSLQNLERDSFERHRERLLEFFAPHPKDINRIRKDFYWIEENPSTVGVYLSSDADPDYAKEYLARSASFFSSSPIFIVCCDDPEFAKRSFPQGIDDVFFVEGEPDTIHLRILSLCAHNIIDASPLGWWGAWLNPRSDKTVICPDGTDCPNDWIRLGLPE